jgi:hypothetical protein
MLGVALGAAAQDNRRQAAAEACEAEVAGTVKRMRGRDAQQVQFVGSKRVLADVSEEETGINGEGRYRGRSGEQTSFTYSCMYNSRTSQTSGVMFRETADVAAPSGTSAAALPADAPIASTEACETAVAKALKDKHPRTSRIVFGSDTRSMQPAADSRTAMEGEGAIERAPGMSAVRFSYRCLFEPRSGKVERVQTSE